MTTAARQLQHLMSPLLPHLEGGTEDIAIQEPQTAFIRRGGSWKPVNVPELDFDTLVDMTILAASITGQNTGDRMPLLFTDIPMERGPELRLMAIQWPAVEMGRISWTLRQPGLAVHDVDNVTLRYRTDRWNQWQKRHDNRDHSEALKLFDSGNLAGFLKHLVRSRYNILCCGHTGSGKTTMGNTLIEAIPAEERIITIENAREYRLTRHKNKLHLLYSQGSVGVAKHVTQKDLQRASLRSRPDRVLVQELLDSEAAQTYIEEVVSGHPGSITTIHGQDAAQAFKRLFNMVKASVAGASQEDATVVSILASAVDCIIPFHNEGDVFSIREVFFAPDAKRRGERHADLLL